MSTRQDNVDSFSLTKAILIGLSFFVVLGFVVRAGTSRFTGEHQLIDSPNREEIAYDYENDTSIWDMLRNASEKLFGMDSEVEMQNAVDAGNIQDSTYTADNNDSQDSPSTPNSNNSAQDEKSANYIAEVIANNKNGEDSETSPGEQADKEDQNAFSTTSARTLVANAAETVIENEVEKMNAYVAEAVADKIDESADAIVAKLEGDEVTPMPEVIRHTSPSGVVAGEPDPEAISEDKDTEQEETKEQTRTLGKAILGFWLIAWTEAIPLLKSLFSWLWDLTVSLINGTNAS